MNQDFKASYCMLLLILVVSVNSYVDDPQFPPKFTQFFIFHGNDDETNGPLTEYNLPGQYWLDVQTQQMRFDFVNIYPWCWYGFFYGDRKNCTSLTTNNRNYQILTKQNKCCYQQLDGEFDRVVMSPTDYFGNRTLEGKGFLFWHQNEGFMTPPVSYYATKTPTQVPRRFCIEDQEDQNHYIGLDFWTNTFKTSFSNNVFAVPDICKNAPKCFQELPSELRNNKSRRFGNIFSNIVQQFKENKKKSHLSKDK